MRLFASAAVLAALLSVPALAQEAPVAPAEPTATQPAPDTGKKDAKKDEGVICRREIPTGSLFAVKVCTTAEQRKAQSGAARSAQGAMQGGSQQVPH
ncbi:hypothetical protein [Caulobacter sp.]|uniref:hypothetical protein n=1 Tax=Caulobacter sp. TaxID=78 RepID=UPI001B0F5787|nr:hypothetical protein [Caulobacter sp.]MBO9545627.1 hypothetical protein [Caulobacter sp.]